MEGLLAGKNAIVTGGTSGIGESVVREYVKEGATVTFCARHEEAGKKLEAELGDKVQFVKADVTSEADIKNLIAKANEKFGPVNVLVNNAGSAYTQPFEALDMDHFRKVLDVNFFAYVELAKEVVPQMLENGGGSIINTSSCGSKLAGPGNEAYCTSKAAVSMLTRCLAWEYATRNIRVNAVLPGVISTPMAPAGGAFEKRMMPLIPMQRPGTVDEVAPTYAYLASDKASYITGALVSVDGGVVAQIQ